jgi:hypothetical protein
MHVRRLVAVVVACAIAVTGISTELATAGPSSQASSAKAKKPKAKKRHRTGGKVRLAWPYTKKGRPSDPLARASGGTGLRQLPREEA